jgi:hypothetical protein
MYQKVRRTTVHYSTYGTVLALPKKLVVFATYKTIEKSKQWNMYGLGGGDQNNGVRLHMWTCDEQNENQNGRW